MFKYSSLFLNGNSLVWYFYANRYFKSTSKDHNQINGNLFNSITLIISCVIAILGFSMP